MEDEFLEKIFKIDKKLYVIFNDGNKMHFESIFIENFDASKKKVVGTKIKLKLK